MGQNTVDNPENVVPVVKAYKAEEWDSIAREGLVVRRHSWVLILLSGKFS
jgi:hypothetical protein